MRAFFALALMFAAMPAMATMPMGVNRNARQSCDSLINSLAGFRGMDTGGKKFSDIVPLVNFKNGKLVVNRENKNFRSVETVNGKTVVKFNEPIVVMGDSCPECVKNGGMDTQPSTTTLTFEEGPNGYVVKYDIDPAAVKNIDDQQKKMTGPYGGMGMGPWGMGMGMGMPVTQRASVDKVEGQCELNQDSFKSRYGGKDYDTVIHDSKFCKSIEGTLKDKGFDKISACKNTFEEIGKKYFERAAEIAKEKPGTAFVDYNTMGGNSMSTYQSIMALQTCAPTDWQERWTQEFMKANYPQGTTPTTPTNAVPGPGNR